MPFVETRFISPTTLTTSASSALYTVPTGYSAIIKQLVVTNITGTAATFTFYIGAASAGNALFSGTSVAANDTVIINLSQVLTTGEVLRALASTNSALNLTVSGVLNDGPLASTATYIADNAITSAKIADGAIVNADINASAAIDKTKISGTAVTVADTGTVTSTMILDGTIATADIAANAVTQAKLSTDIPLSGFRNILINGGFDVWQRGTAQTTLPATLATAFLADRWSGFRAVAGCTQTRIASGLNGFQYAIRLQRTSGNDTVNPMYLEQSFETSTISKVAGLPVVVSFYARAGANFTGSTILARMGVGTGTERDVIWSGGWTSYTEPLSQQVTPTTDWQRFVLYVTVPAGTTQAGFYFTVSPTGTAVANDYVDITGVQIEAGSQVTPFEQRPITTELALCQRYYENSGYPNYTVPTGVTGQGAWIPAASAYTLCSEPQFKTVKRGTPTITIYNTNTLASGSITEYIAGGAFQTNRTSAVSYVSTTKFMVNSAAQYATGRDYNFSWEAYVELA